jgi:hypothetical protein
MAQSARFFAIMTFLGVAIFGYATGVLMGPHAAVIGERLPELTCLQIAFSSERANEVIGAFSAAEQAAIARLLVPGDVVFAWGYGLLLAGLLGLLTLRLPPDWQRWGRVLMWTPLLASGFDCVEDVLLLQVVDAGVGADHGAIPLLAGIAATLKYLNLSVIAPAYGMLGSVKGITVDRRWDAWLVYVLVIVNAVAFVARPLQQIPPCL